MTQKLLSAFICLILFSCTAEKIPPEDKIDYRENFLKILQEFETDISLDGRVECFSNSKKTGIYDCAAIKDCVSDGVAKLNQQIAALADTKENFKARHDLFSRRATLLSHSPKTFAESELAFGALYEYAKKYDLALALNALAKKGTVQMRRGEIKNCIENHNSDSCIFPLSKAARHLDKSGSLAAKASFLEYLEQNPENEMVKWLLAIVQMTIGQYPEGIPAKFRIDTKKLESEEGFLRFRDIAMSLGVHGMGNSGGLTIEDINGDGFLDLLTGSLNPCDGIQAYLFSAKEKKFKQSTEQIGLAGQNGVGLILPVDFDNDGDIDLYLTRGAWHSGGASKPFSRGFSYNSLMRNDGTGHFSDVTAEFGLRGEPNSNLSSNWADFNNDGWMDLFVCNESRDPDLFLSDAGKKFINHSKKSRIVNKAICKGSAVGDFDNDGNLDLALSNYAGPNRVYFGNGDGSFRKSESFAETEAPLYSFPVNIFDINNDGNEDVLFAANSPDVGEFAKWLAGKKFKADSAKVFLGNGRRGFSDQSEEMRMNRPFNTMSMNVGDLDNDGFLDVYLGTGKNSIADLIPNILFRNVEGRVFRDVTISAGVGSLQKGHGIAFVDYDSDGDQDIFLQQGGVTLTDRFMLAIFQNPGNKNS
jgi:hypothetical protein